MQNKNVIKFEEKQYLKNFELFITSRTALKVRHKILLVDDEPDNLQLLKRVLRTNYDIMTASNGKEALDLVELHGNDISLIISDQRMPVMSGTEFFTEIKDRYPRIIKILLTGFSDIDTLIESVNNCNLFQYVLKPFTPEDLIMIIQNGIRVYDLKYNKESLLQELKELFFTTIKSIASALDAKDRYTHGHSMRVTMYSLILANQLDFSTSVLEDIETAGLLHDIGKIGVPEEILKKPGKLTSEEYEKIKEHPLKGKHILDGIEMLSNIAYWVSCHHEKWDGTGYPYSIAGENIPIAARILSIADTYDAMTSDRSYRNGLPHEVAVAEIIRCSETQFDPSLIEIFKKVSGEIASAKDNYDEYYSKYSLISKSLAQKE